MNLRTSTLGAESRDYLEIPKHSSENDKEVYIDWRDACSRILQLHDRCLRWVVIC